MTERIRAIHAESDATYGMPRVRAELIDQGVQISAQAGGAADAPERHSRRQPAPRLHRHHPARPASSARRPIWSSASSSPTARTSCGWPT